MLRVLDGFGYQSTDVFQGKWTIAGSSNGVTYEINSDGRYENGCIQARDTIDSAGGDKYIATMLDDKSTWIIGFGYKASSFSIIGFAGSGVNKIFRAMENSIEHIQLRFSEQGHLYVTNNATTLGVANKLLLLNTWQYIEIKFTIHDTNGFVEVKLNGKTVLRLENVDTRNGGNGVVNTFGFLAHTRDGGNNTLRIDDLYICDTEGPNNNDFLGPIRVTTLHPNANGNSSQFVGSDGDSTDNYQLVDEVTIATGDFVQSSTLGFLDLYNFENMSGDVSHIYAVQESFVARNTDSGSGNLIPKTRIASTNYSGSGLTVDAGFEPVSFIWELSPATAGVWTSGEIAGAEFGMEIG